MSAPPASIGVAAPAQSPLLQAFLRDLATELSAGPVELPSWSKVTERARVALADETASNDDLARLLGAEAGLAVRVLAIANSAMFTRGGKPLSDLKLAILRIGHDNLRSAVYSYALAQLRHAPKFQHLRATFQQLWHNSTHVAALSRLVAVHTGSGDADLAVLAGLLHNIGKLYIHVRLDAAAAPLRTAAAEEELLAGWQARIGSAVARNWQLPDALCEALAEQDLLTSDVGEQSALGATLAAAVLGVAGVTAVRPAGASQVMAGALAQADAQAQTAEHLATFSRFGLPAPAWQELLDRAYAETMALRVTFGD
jgi:HD-like signal output (HDOD) protein